MKLRKYQEDGLVSIRDFFNSSLKTGIYVSPVGTGKSILIAEAAKMRKNVLVLQPSSELLKQNYEKYSYYGFPASIYSASLKSRQVSDVTFATIGSVMGEKDRFKGVDTIIVDEVHRGSKKDNLLSELVSYLNVEKVLGFTATPIMAQNTKDESYLRMMDSYRECIFDNIIHITQIQEILPFWTPIEYKFSNELNPKGVAVSLKAQHLCMNMRGVKKHDTWTITSKLLGAFKDDDKARAEFLSFIK